MAVRWSTEEFTMTQTTNEHNFEPGFYVIGIFDVLGQRSRLLEPITFPPGTDDETQAVGRNLFVIRVGNELRVQADDEKSTPGT